MAPQASKKGKKFLLLNKENVLILCLAGKDLIVGIKHMEINTNNAPKDIKTGT